jgi:fibronectin-binding autotransporter adhesin
VPGLTSETGGFLSGCDQPVGENIYVGVAGGYLHSNIDEHSTSSGTESSARFAVYGGALLGPSLLTATAG